VQFWSVLFGAILLVVGSNLFSTPSAYASVPNGFADSVVANISAPTDIAFTPDGTMLVTSQNGGLYKRSGSSTTKVLDLSGKICSDFERGLLGVTVDPLYASNNYIYLYYTYNRHNTCIDNSPSSPNNRVSRFVFNGSRLKILKLSAL